MRSCPIHLNNVAKTRTQKNGRVILFMTGRFRLACETIRVEAHSKAVFETNESSILSDNRTASINITFLHHLSKVPHSPPCLFKLSIAIFSEGLLLPYMLLNLTVPNTLHSRLLRASCWRASRGLISKFSVTMSRLSLPLKCRSVWWPFKQTKAQKANISRYDGRLLSIQPDWGAPEILWCTFV